MKTRKSGAYAALAAVLLISAVLITNCVDPINPGGLFVPKGKDQPAAFVPPPGMGYVMLNFGAGRTIRPLSGYVTDVDDFTRFDVQLTAVAGQGGATVPAETVVAAAPKTALQVLEDKAFTASPGKYNFEVWAYTAAGATAKTGAVAYGVSDEFTVSAGTGSSQGVVLGVITDATAVGSTGKGTFTWALTSNTSITKVELTIAEYLSGDPVENFEDEDITGKLTGGTATATLDPGYYRVSFACTGPGVKSATIREILHVYQGMTSHHAASLPTLNPNEYTITYVFNDTNNTPTTSNFNETGLVHGAAIAGPTTPPSAANYYPGYTWQGWFTTNVAIGTSAAGGNLAAINVYTPIKTQTLYGRWVHEGLYVTVTWEEPTDENDPVITVTDITVPASPTPINATGYTLSRETPPTIRFAVAAPPGGGSYSNYEWSVSTTNNEGNGATFDLNFASAANIQLLIAGDLEIMVKADYSGAPLNGSVKLTIGN